MIKFVATHKLSAVALAAVLIISDISASTNQKAAAVVPQNWQVSYADPGVEYQSTDLVSPTMVTESFDDDATWGYDCCTAISAGSIAGIGQLSGYGHRFMGDYYWGGAGGTGGFPQAGDLTITLDSAQRYVGFWWSAGNANNNIELFDSNDNSLGIFSTADLLSTLGPCPATPVETDYCGNPNFGGPIESDPAVNEPFAYVHIRYAAGFKKIRFFGEGFEFDNISFSQTVPDLSSHETALPTDSPITSCADIDASYASEHLTACPRSIIIPAGQYMYYSPLQDSQIASFAYPYTAYLSSIQRIDGNAHQERYGDQIMLESDEVGTFTVAFTVSQGDQSATSYIYVTVERIAMVAPIVVPFDPRADQIHLPKLALSDSTNAMLCISQLSDPNGWPLESADFDVSPGDLISGVSFGSALNLFTLTGPMDSVANQSEQLVVSGISGQRLSSGESIYLRISASPATNFGTDACESDKSVVIELRPLNLALTKLTAIMLH